MKIIPSTPAEDLAEMRRLWKAEDKRPPYGHPRYQPGDVAKASGGRHLGKPQSKHRP